MTEPVRRRASGGRPFNAADNRREDGDNYVINGNEVVHHRAEHAAFNTSSWRDGRRLPQQCSCPTMDRAGITLERLWTARSCFTGGHGVLSSENLRVPAAMCSRDVGGCPCRTGTLLRSRLPSSAMMMVSAACSAAGDEPLRAVDDMLSPILQAVVCSIERSAPAPGAGCRSWRMGSCGSGRRPRRFQPACFCSSLAATSIRWSVAFVPVAGM